MPKNTRKFADVHERSQIEELNRRYCTFKLNILNNIFYQFKKHFRMVHLKRVEIMI